MRNKILTTVEQAFLTAEAFYGRTFDRPTLIEFKRNGTKAGHCLLNNDLSKRELMFQLDLAENNPDDFLAILVPHEVAHYIQFMFYAVRDGRIKNKLRSHGREWKFVMQVVYKIPADRCHDYDVSQTSHKRELRHTYGCKCCKEFSMSSTMHNKIQNDLKDNPVTRWSPTHGHYVTGRYVSKICPSCKSVITLKKLGDPVEKKMNDLKKQLAVLELRLKNQIKAA